MNRSLMRHAGRARVFLVWAVVLGVLAAVATIAQMVFLAEVVGRVFLGGDGLGQMVRPLALLLCAVVARAGLLWAREVVALRGAVEAKRALREGLLDHLLRLGPAYCGGERAGELVTTGVEGVERLETYFARYLPQVALSAIVPLLVAGYVVVLDPLSAAVLLATGPAIVVLMVLIGKHAEEHTRLRWAALSRMGAHFLDVLRGLPTLKAFGRAAAERERVAEISTNFGKRTMEVLRVAFVSGLALEFVATVSVGLIAVLLGVRMLYGDLPFAVAFPVLLLAPEFYRPLRELGASRHAGMEGKAAAERIGEILDTPAEETEGSHHVPHEPITVELASVSFTYPGGTRPALCDAGLVLPAGTRTALVGPSGAGKSTLVDLLLRFAEPQSGRILANGVHVADLAADSWREKIALVPQRPHLFYGSVLENLRLARSGASRGEIEAAAKLAGAHDFISRLPQGYDTHVGERAVRLSEGEAQRVAIARAFLKDAPVLVMDEPASGLDPESERLIQEALHRLARDRTVLVVAHRLGTARDADQIVVLEEGRVAETGPHDELAGRGGPYNRLLDASLHVDGGLERWETHDQKRSPDARNGHHHKYDRLVLDGETSRQEEDPVGKQAGYRAGTLGRLLLFLASRWRRVALAVLLGVWTMGANVGLLAVSGYLIAAAALHPPLSALIPAAVLVQVFGASRGFSRYAERLVSHEVTFGLLADLRAWLYGRLEPLSPARLVRRRGGDLLARLMDDVEELQNVYLGAISPAITAAAVSALTCAILYLFAPSLALAAFGFLVLAGVVAPLAVGVLERGTGRRQVGLRADLVTELAEWLWGMRDLLAFGRAREGQSKVSDVGRKLGREQQKAAFGAGLGEAVHDLAAGLAGWTVLVLAIPLVRGGEIGGVYLALILLATLASFEAVRPLGEAFRSLGRSLAAGERLFEISDSKPTVTDPVKPRPLPPDHSLRFDRVTFRYGDDEPPVLEDVSFELVPGKRIAVVGPSGSGKSTLVNLALRFWDPQHGAMFLGGNDAREYDQEDLRSILSVAAQDAHLFDATLRENLLLANPGAAEPELWSALEKAQLDGFVRDLPRGLETPVGESGSRLSGGERRRLAVARALLKDAPLLLLDEPTADLDAGTERRLLDAVYGHTDGRGLLLITHRLVGMEQMDEILMLEDGRISERGTHEELMRANGPYSRMVGVQEQMLVGL